MSDSVLPDAETTPVLPLWPDAGRALGLGKSATYLARDRGELPVMQLGGRCYVVTAELRRRLGLDGDPARGMAATPEATGAVAPQLAIRSVATKGAGRESNA